MLFWHLYCYESSASLGYKFSLNVDKIYSYGLVQQHPQHITNYSCPSRKTFSRSLKTASIKHGLVYLC